MAQLDRLTPIAPDKRFRAGHRARAEELDFPVVQIAPRPRRRLDRSSRDGFSLARLTGQVKLCCRSSGAKRHYGRSERDHATSPASMGQMPILIRCADEPKLGRNVFGANCECRATPKTYTKKMLSSKGLKMSKIWRLTQCCFCGWTAKE